jgi:hypothetical protein
MVFANSNQHENIGAIFVVTGILFEHAGMSQCASSVGAHSWHIEVPPCSHRSKNRKMARVN